MSQLKCSEDLKKLFLDFAYPIGSVWMTRTKDDPNKIMGGTWVAIDGAYIYATNISQNCDTGYCGTGNKTRDHAITIAQMPSHNHNSSIRYAYGQTGPVYSMVWENGDWQGPYGNGGMGVLNIKNTGGNQGHSHVIPWIGVHFWYRTA